MHTQLSSNFPVRFSGGSRMYPHFNMTVRWLRHAFAMTSMVMLAACGSGSGPSTQQNANTTATIQQVQYTGPAPTSADVQAFKNEFWNNIVTSQRCGGCHNQTKGQNPEFARSDDVNQAYQAALQVVNLAQPDQSTVVTKVGGGHNCWTSSPSACADILTTWIRNWASASGNATSTGTQIQLVAPTDHDLTNTTVTVFPNLATDGGANSFQNLIWNPILHHQNPLYCAKCHNPNAATPQQPYFASDDVNEAFAAAQAKIDLGDAGRTLATAQSRFVVRLRDESHNCWSDCATDAQAMFTAIQQFASNAPNVTIDPTLSISKGLIIDEGGIVSSGANRYETHMIARYFFKEGSGNVAHDTSGVDPAADLNLTTNVTWVGGWGINIPAGDRAQATVDNSAKLYDRITASGEFTVEAWVAPANVAQKNAYMVSYSGGKTTSNFALAQNVQQYDSQVTNSNSKDQNGNPAVLTNLTDMVAQASLQHVVMTYDPVNGRQIYVNGALVAKEGVAGSSLTAAWNNTYALVLGNDPSGTNMWSGLIKFVEIHDRALTLDQIQQNFAAGVGERYAMLFDVSALTNLAKSYVMFEVSQYDSYSYLFNKPTFISLDPTVQPGNLEIKGMRIGINGTEAATGQAYIPLDVTVSNANYNSTSGQLLSNIGTVIALQKGPANDLLFLTFEKIGPTTSTHDYSDTTVVSITPPTDLPPVSDIGFRTFEQIDAAMSKLTGISRSTNSTTYLNVQQQMPAIHDFDAFNSSNQIGISQLAVAYCNSLIASPTAVTSFFGSGLNLSAPINTQKTALINPIINNFFGTGLSTSPDSTAVSNELSSLIDKLCTTSSCSNTSRTPVVATAVCTAALASAATTVQ